MYLKINGQNLYYQKIGKGKDLIILHGWKQDVSSFWNIVDFLKNDFTLWLIDLPGFGRSDLPKKTYKLLDYASTIISFIQKNKIRKPTLLGHSLGGNIALKIALVKPDIIDKIILESSAGIRPQKSFKKILFFFLAKISNLFIPNIFNLKQKVRIKFYKKIRSDYSDAGPLKKSLKEILAEDLSDQIKKIKNDTLLISGELDKEVPISYSKKIYQLIPNARIEIFENTGHFPHLENPEIFTQYVKDFS